MRRVVVTGMAGISPIGSDWSTIEDHLRSGTNGIKVMEEWNKYPDLNTRLGAPVSDFSRPTHYARKKIRSMGRVALMSTRATELALEHAGLLNDPCIQDGRMGVSYGSSTGSPDAVSDFGNMLINHASASINANSYLKMMSHTAAVNIGVFFELKGRVIPTSSACTSASQGIGYAYEAIKYGHQELMVAGGGEELCATEAAVFDTLYATSTRNDEPHLSPRPFDRDRDGLVIGEGACSLILEEREHAIARGANILAEIVGFGTNSDGSHVTQPQTETMFIAMQRALKIANLPASAIGYISAHGTATDRGDIAESQATAKLFGNKTPISALKSFTGHTLGACGSLEAMTAIEMMNRGWFHGTANLNNIDPECGELDYLVNDGRNINVDYIMSNNFAFGGINTSLIFKRTM
ncbi:3-oxoacyl-[acyl-carrier-protein] synthase 1 [Zhongshania aliphaticivorans]|uniref:3-oxoacyl-[acyl-carrier-protein] synthase 1 n=1 Tax=Zhongshania aliphaticivorans TaxID=1470434 RepID=A0A5S9P6E7_9GAMM|nr:beta-ketoacyl-ACP synthase [Zhongshania aliphaticivorans]CAA0091650.1 3-oxoacyl-[acyl-carrier-protein] synthase 1 [Zhongshania aliphaticivorans]CAA0099005.1 3-oxoacyl-[acyl-carrier-protein] synthase 1 [Zhongshania aliphaticivorans]